METEFKIVKFNELRQNIVLSRKEILSNDLDDKRKEIIEKIKIDEVLEGIVKNITDFGAFIDLGGIDGLLHITDTSQNMNFKDNFFGEILIDLSKLCLLNLNYHLEQ